MRCAAHPEDGNNAQIHHKQRGGVKKRGELANGDGGLGLVVSRLVEALILAPLLPKGPHHAHAREVLARDKAHLVKARLELAKERNGPGHHQPKNHRNDGRADEKHKAKLSVDEHGADHGANGQNGPPDDLPDAKSHRDLYLVNVVRDASDQRGRAYTVEVGRSELVHLGVEIVTDVRAGALGDNSCHLLAHQREAEANQGKHNENHAHANHVALVTASDAHVNHTGNDDRRDEVKYDLDGLAERAKNDLPPILGEDEPP
jgi:hypothetical protein